MSKLRSVYFENFESLASGNDAALVRLVDVNGVEGESGWRDLTAGDQAPFFVSTTNPIEGRVSVALQGPPAGGGAYATFVVRELTDGPITSYELRWKHQNAASAYPFSTNKPFNIWVENVNAEFPWFVDIHSDSVRITDNGGLSSSLANPGTSVHDYRLTDDGVGNIELFIDGGSVHTGTAITMTPQEVDRVALGHNTDTANTGLTIVTGRLDAVNLLQEAATGFNAARIFIGK